MDRRLALIAAASLAAACAHGEVRRVGTHLPGDPSWPRGDARRIAWVGEIRGPENLGIERGFFARAWDFITGQEALEGLYRPYGLAVDAAGRLAVADPGRRTVHVYDRAAGRTVRIKGTAEAPLIYPVAVAFLGRTLLVADAEAGTLSAWDDRGEPVPVPVALPALVRPTGLAVDQPRERLFVVDAAAHVVHVLPTGTGGTPRVLGGRGSGPGLFNAPTHVAVDGQGRLAVCDAFNFRVQLFDAELRFAGTFGQNGDGQGDLARPKGLVIDRDGVVFVVEGYFDVIQAFQADGTLLGVIGGSGTGPGRLWLAGGMALDALGRLYVADTFNARVQVFDLDARAP